MKRYGVYLGFGVIWLLFSSSFFVFQKIPAPLDLLVNFFVPWDKYYDSPIKNPSISDVVNQIIPWKTYTVWSLKQGKIPLWNPYNLAGSPYLANWQSGVLYPTNLLFLFTKFTDAWSFHILLQPLLAGIFMILYLRSLKLSQWASLLGAISFAYGGFMTVWLEWGTLGHALLWLPLALYGVEQGRGKREEGRRPDKWMLIIVFSWVMSLLAGHLQVSLYVIGVSLVYLIVRNWNLFRSKLKLLMFTVYCLLFTVFLASPQLLPAAHLYLNSYRAFSYDPEWFKAFRIPTSGLLTFLAPDFFGSPVTRNHWSDHSYVEMMGYIGIVPLIFAMYTGLTFRVAKKGTKRVLKFFFFLIIVGLLFSLKTPIANSIVLLKIPVLASSSPARIIGVVSFSLAVLSAYGIDLFIEHFKEKKILELYKILGGVAVLFAGMWLWSFLSSNPNSLVTRHNLVFPTGIFLSLAIGYSVNRLFGSRQRVLLFTVYCLLFTVFDLFRFHHKFTPFTDEKYFYPKIPVIEFLQHHEGRVFGLFDANMNLPFRIPSVEGYDPLVLKDYVAYTSRAEMGETSLPIRTSSVQLPKNGKNTMKILNELGVKYVVQPTVHGAQPWELHLWEYANQFHLVYHDDEYEVYENMLAQNPVEPYASLRPIQEKLFIMGCIVSGITLLGLVAWSRKRSYD